MQRLKLMASGDHHFDEDSRFAECIRVHGWIAEQVETERPNVFVSAGDIYERASTPLERSAVADWLQRIAAVCPVVIAKGNHDRPRDCQLLARLRAPHPIIVQEAAGVHDVGGFAVAAMAWPNKSSIAAMLGRPVAIEQLDDVAREALRDVLRGLGAELAAMRASAAYRAAPQVLVGHFMVDGSLVSTGQPLIGAEQRVGLADLALSGAAMVLCGHIHFPQEWEHDGTPIVYTGSPFRTAFGELEGKSIVVAEFDGPKLASWRRVATPATQMVLLDGCYQGGCLDVEAGHGGFGDLALVIGAEVRVRYEVAADERDAARIEAQRYCAELVEKWGALSVKCEEVVRATTRSRAPEIAAARTLDEKLPAYWRARGLDIPEERQRRLLGRAHELEEAA